jgi:hypothetical protein
MPNWDCGLPRPVLRRSYPSFLCSRRRRRAEARRHLLLPLHPTTVDGGVYALPIVSAPALAKTSQTLTSVTVTVALVLACSSVPNTDARKVLRDNGLCGYSKGLRWDHARCHDHRQLRQSQPNLFNSGSRSSTCESTSKIGINSPFCRRCGWSLARRGHSAQDHACDPPATSRGFSPSRSSPSCPAEPSRGGTAQRDEGDGDSWSQVPRGAVSLRPLKEPDFVGVQARHCFGENLNGTFCWSHGTTRRKRSSSASGMHSSIATEAWLWSMRRRPLVPSGTVPSYSTS